MQNIYYVYVYLDTRKKKQYIFGKYHFEYAPFYVGKGKNLRYLKHLIDARTNENSYKLNTIRKIQKITGEDPKIIKLECGLSNEKACEIEKYLIKIMKNSNLNLTNITPGGDGGDTLSNHPRKQEIFQTRNFVGINNPNFGSNKQQGIKNGRIKYYYLIESSNNLEEKVCSIKNYCSQNNLHYNRLCKFAFRLELNVPKFYHFPGTFTVLKITRKLLEKPI